MQPAKDGRMMLDLNEIVNKNHIASQLECSSSPWQQEPMQLHDIIKTEHNSTYIGELFTFYLEIWSPGLHKHGLLNHVTQEEFFPVSLFDKITVNMTSCS